MGGRGYSRGLPSRLNLALIGDSTLDNVLYTKGGACVKEHLENKLGKNAKVTLLAKDGAVLKHAAAQLKKLPRGVTHIVISLGGNNALGALGVLRRKVSDVHGALVLLREVQKSFQKEYEAMLDAVSKKGLPILLCLQYNPRMTHYAQFK